MTEVNEQWCRGLPAWLTDRLRQELGLSDAAIGRLSEAAARRKLEEHARVRGKRVIAHRIDRETSN
jgi:hypothetical protein